MICIACSKKTKRGIFFCDGCGRMITHNRLANKTKRLEFAQIMKYDMQINPIKPGDRNNIVGWDILNYLGIRGGA